ncbi:MAG TPA: alpha/beta fold hydrolase [Candidatus Udaeobacter sp.]
MKRLAPICAGLIGIAVLCALSIGWLLARLPTNANWKACRRPKRSNGDVRKRFKCKCHGWWCPIQNARGTVLLLPGIRANRLSMVDRARFLRRAGYSVLLIDFQATGETKGDHITFGWKESRDVLAAASFLHHVDPTARVGIIGSSLGGVAALLATPPLKVDALVLEEVYPTVEIATRNRMENYLGRVGRIATPVLLNQLQWRLGISASQLRPLDHIARVECPLLIISGEKDRNTRKSDTRMLVERTHSPKHVWFVPNAGHVDLHRVARDEYESRVLAFLREM